MNASNNDISIVIAIISDLCEHIEQCTLPNVKDQLFQLDIIEGWSFIFNSGETPAFICFNGNHKLSKEIPATFCYIFRTADPMRRCGFIDLNGAAVRGKIPKEFFSALHAEHAAAQIFTREYNQEPGIEPAQVARPGWPARKWQGLNWKGRAALLYPDAVCLGN